MTIDIAFIWHALQEIFKVLPLTLFMTCTPVCLGILIGIIVAFVRIKQLKILAPLLNFYVSFSEAHRLLCILCLFTLEYQLL